MEFKFKCKGCGHPFKNLLEHKNHVCVDEDGILNDENGAISDPTEE